MSSSVKVGIVSIVAILLLYFGINFLKGVNVLSSSKVFYAYYVRNIRLIDNI